MNYYEKNKEKLKIRTIIKGVRKKQRSIIKIIKMLLNKKRKLGTTIYPKNKKN